VFWKPREPVNEADTIRLLNQPRPLAVAADDNGLPRAVGTGAAWQLVAGIVDVWRIDDEWWRTTISRRYFLLTLEDGVSRTVFQDLIGDGWYEQHA
jgi:transposase InsO family protein